MSEKNKGSVLVWFRQDLRLDDNPAFYHAAKSGLNVIPLYIWSPESEGNWPMGSASKVWLQYSLLQLATELEKLNSKLLLAEGDPKSILNELIKKYNVKKVVWNRRYEPDIIKRDKIIKSDLKNNQIEVNSFNGSLLYEPNTILNKQGSPYKVYTAFWNATQQMPEPAIPYPKPRKLISAPDTFDSLPLKYFKLLPDISWHRGIENNWQPGTAAAKKQVKRFLAQDIENYQQYRDYPAIQGVSSLSPYLHFGEISPNSVWHEIQKQYQNKKLTTSAIVYKKQLVWREFAHHLLFHFPHTDQKPLRDEFKHFPWKKNKRFLNAWQKGETGYPIVDAGMRQLWQTGWMHNRVRMIVASFLIKDCLIHWLEGANWFWDTLVDADLANNTMGWQWVAGSGADAAPYFRIFNPVTQGERFDPKGEYVRCWIPELSMCPDKYIHQPWNAPAMELQLANIKLGKDYPNPIVDHSVARKQALEALKQMQAAK